MNSPFIEIFKSSFPWHIFHLKNLQSPAQRVADVCRFWAHNNPPTLRWIGLSRAADFTCLTLTCASDLLLTRISLASLLRHASALPNLVIAYDETLTASTLQLAFADWPGQIKTYSRANVADEMDERGNSALGQFCRDHIFGFKLAACVKAADVGRVLYSDADVLWFGDCCELMARYTKGAVIGSYDIGQAVEMEVVEMFESEIKEMLLSTPRVCAGFTIFNKPVSEHKLIRDIVPKILEQSPIRRLAEQTLVGALAKTTGSVILPEHVQMVVPTSASLISAVYGRPAFARHYPIALRPQFWIDAVLAR